MSTLSVAQRRYAQDVERGAMAMMDCRGWSLVEKRYDKAGVLHCVVYRSAPCGAAQSASTWEDVEKDLLVRRACVAAFEEGDEELQAWAHKELRRRCLTRVQLEESVKPRSVAGACLSSRYVARAELVFVHDGSGQILDAGVFEALAQERYATASAPDLCVFVVGPLQLDDAAKQPPLTGCGLYGCQVRRNGMFDVDGPRRRSWVEDATSALWGLNAQWTWPDLEVYPASAFAFLEIPEELPYLARDVREVLEASGVRYKAQLPRVRPDDVVVLLLGGKIGDVVVYPADEFCDGPTFRIVVAEGCYSANPLF